MRQSKSERIERDLSDPPTIHLYPADPRYRRSGAIKAQPGDIARCGWVKQNPSHPQPRGSENCLMCIRLKGLEK
jgi:hypothetical protein